MATYLNQLGNYASYRYVVTNPQAGPYPTIQSAINQALADGASASIFIQPGTYIESLTLYDGISLLGSQEGHVIIIGTHTPPVAGSLSINNCTLQTDTNVLSSAAAGTTAIAFDGCLFNITNGYVFNMANWTGDLSIARCTEISAHNKIVTNTAGAAIGIQDSYIGSGATGMAVTGITAITNSRIFCPITGSGNAVISIDSGSVIDGAIAISGTATLSIYNSRITSGAIACITTTSTGLTTIEGCVLDSSAAAAIAGTGAIEMGSITFNDVSVIAGTITYDNASLFAASNVNVENILFLAGDAGSAGQVLTSNGVAAPTWQAGGGGSSFTWHNVSTATNLEPNNGYIVGGGAAVAFTLTGAPTSWNPGQVIRILIDQTYGGSFSILLANHYMSFGNVTVTPAQTISSTNAGDFIEITCCNTFGGYYRSVVTGVIGNLSVV